MYFSNSQPAATCRCPPPRDETSCGSPLLRRGVEQLLDELQLAVAADERRLEPAPSRIEPPRPRRREGRARAAPARPCPSARAGPRPRRRSPPRSRASSPRPTSTVPGRCSRLNAGGRVDEIAGNHALTVAPSVTAASPVRTPARARSSRIELRASHGDEVERGANGPLGVVLLRDRRAPDRHHGVADELLDRAAVALDHRAARRRSSGSGARACPPHPDLPRRR